jgi:hypothetical protein
MFKKIICCLFILAVFICCCNKAEKETVQHNNKRLRDAIVSYMSEPMFRNKNFVQQITGTEADLKLYDMDEQMLYFVINKSDYDSTGTLGKLTIDPSSAEFGIEQNGDIFLGAYTLKGTGRMLFRIPKGDFKPDTASKVTVKLSDQFDYNITANELADFADDKSIFGGKTNAETGKDKYMANHGAFVSIPGEPSLMELCRKITGGEKKKEAAAQMLLDFVTNTIKFSESEAYGGYEVLKRPNEVLMTGVSDCSGLTILYASLLEQAGIDYRLVYFPGHIAVAINGDFPDLNKTIIKYEGVEYHLAETTVKGFRIGITGLLQKDLTSELRYIQKPGKDSKIINVKDGSIMN